MKTYKHIRDCWNALNDCTTLDEINKTIKDFPNKFGIWSATDNKDRTVCVTNYYYDKSLDDYCEESEDFDIDIEDEEEE